MLQAIYTINVIISLIGRTKTRPKNPNTFGSVNISKTGKIKVLKAEIQSFFNGIKYFYNILIFEIIVLFFTNKYNAFLFLCQAVLI